MRVGIGYDVHRFGGQGPLRLGGVVIPHPKGLRGHSDADVLLHAVADALFGAIGAPDIGEQFPSSDMRFRGMASRVFVTTASAQARRKGWVVENLDAVVIADAPTLAGHKVKMSRAIGRLLGIEAARVSVKAKTTAAFSPGPGGIAAHVVVLVKPAVRRRKKG